MKLKRMYLFGVVATFSSLLVLISSVNSKEMDKRDVFRFDSLVKFSKVIGVIENYYVEELKFDNIVNKAISGLVENLDSHSSYMFEDELNDMKVKTKGEFGGLGITVGMKDGAITVIAPIEGTPAYKAGIKSRDIILKIDETPTIDMKLDDAVKLMRGAPQTKITLTIVREGENKPLKIDIIRDIIQVKSVYKKEFEKDEGLLYIRVTSFDEKVTDGVREAINSKKKLKGIILDLRNNPGGLLTQAIGLSDIFIKDGIIVSQKGRIKKDIKEYKAKGWNTIEDVPLVVLVNEGSASASEIVSGALQDHKRAIIIGKKTFGKGSVQSIIPVNEKEAIRLTIARYYLPSGRTIQATGVEPDIIVCGCKVPEKTNDFSIKEKDLKRHLKTELEKTSDSNSTITDSNSTMIVDDETTKPINDEMINGDMQLKSAIDTLKILQLKRNM